MRLAVSLAAAATMLALTCQSASAQTLHLISIADTKDVPVGPGFERSFKKFNELADYIKNKAEMKLNQILITGEKYTCDNINKAVRDLKVQPDDTVIFYHAGHGQSSKKSANDKSFSRFPALQCTDSLKIKIPKLEDLSTALTKKGARLTITIADSCNNAVGALQMMQVAGKMTKEQIWAMYRDYKGHILMSSSATGEFSFYELGDNGYGKFTAQLETAHYVSPPENVEYEGLWNYVESRVKNVIHGSAAGTSQTDQHPQVENRAVYVSPASAAASQKTAAPSAVASRTLADVKTLQNGDEGDAVKAVQEALIKIGHLKIKADGKFGDKTEDAVREFQKKSGLNADGAVDKATYSKLGL